MNASQIRQQFLDFFKEKGHQIVPSAPIVVKNDPTLLFTNAGMNQFKDYFLGNKTPDSKRVADTQKCLRVSGKHNDLEEVGVDTYHHTMFEMLGNWSFGDYFKKEAIEWSWELLTEVYKIDKSRLYVTVFEGDAKENLPFDQEAYDEWKKWTVEERILKGNKKDNFWEMGDTGPCGPCSEIHVDCRTDEERAAVDGATLVNADHPQVIEIWNNVFMQFNRLKDGSLQPLPATHVDTGMGFERLVRVLQKKTSNYDTDVFTGTIRLTEEITGKQYDFSDSKQAVAFRVLADHIRAISFTIADGQLPSNTGAGYVIRRILRRAVRYYYSYLDYKSPLLFQLLPHLAEQFEHVFPELFLQKDFVSRVIKEEEESFLRTLDKGLRRMDEAIGNAKDGVINGEEAFKMYDTYGFPIDLTRLIASERNLVVDEADFEKFMKQQKETATAATKIDAEDWVSVNEIEKSTFVGYNDLLVETKLARYRKVKAKGKEQYQLVLETTPFYAESGGQVGDTGVLIFGNEEIEVTDTKKENNLIIHFTDKLPAQPEVPVTAKVDWEKRILTSYNHTATHLMHAALREVLGTHVAQKGSLVNANVLRFDFSHFSKMTDEEIRKVEQIVNEKIRENIPVVIKEMPKDEAIALGAMALFGEKYGDIVRAVIIDPNYSIELCGGTHVGHTGMIGVFSITAESAVAAGVRRIEALTGPAAIQYFAEKVAQNKQITELLKAKDLVKAIEKLIEDKAALEKRINSIEQSQAAEIINNNEVKIERFGEISFISANLDCYTSNVFKSVLNYYRNNYKESIISLSATLKDGSGAKYYTYLLNSKEWFYGANLNTDYIKQFFKDEPTFGGGGPSTMFNAQGHTNLDLNEINQKVRRQVMELSDLQNRSDEAL